MHPSAVVHGWCTQPRCADSRAVCTLCVLVCVLLQTVLDVMRNCDSLDSRQQVMSAVLKASAEVRATRGWAGRLLVLPVAGQHGALGDTLQALHTCSCTAAPTALHVASTCHVQCWPVAAQRLVCALYGQHVDSAR